MFEMLRKSHDIIHKYHEVSFWYKQAMEVEPDLIWNGARDQESLRKYEEALAKMDEMLK